MFQWNAEVDFHIVGLCCPYFKRKKYSFVGFHWYTDHHVGKDNCNRSKLYCKVMLDSNQDFEVILKLCMWESQQLSKENRFNLPVTISGLRKQNLASQMKQFVYMGYYFCLLFNGCQKLGDKIYCSGWLGYFFPPIFLCSLCQLIIGKSTPFSQLQVNTLWNRLEGGDCKRASTPNT